MLKVAFKIDYFGLFLHFLRLKNKVGNFGAYGSVVKAKNQWLSDIVTILLSSYRLYSAPTPGNDRNDSTPESLGAIG